MQKSSIVIQVALLAMDEEIYTRSDLYKQKNLHKERDSRLGNLYKNTPVQETSVQKIICTK